MSETELNDRARQLLGQLVKSYISDGQPVGSRTLAQISENLLSSATIRNVMSELEEIGLIHSPHTSAGRIPTVKGYRFFVDQLLKVKKLTAKELQPIQEEIAAQSSSDDILESASEQLSEITSMAGVVMLPGRELTVLRQIEFLPLASNQILVILVTVDGTVQNRVINPSKQFKASELEQAANYLNHHYAGKELSDIRSHILASMDETRQSMDQMMSAAIDMARQVIDSSYPSEQNMVIAGQTKLMGYSDMGDIDKLRQLFDAFNQKQDILQLFDRSLQAQGVQIFIGEESGYKVLDECSIVTSPYEVDGEPMGVIGVIGPTRMAYERVIPIVDITAQLLGTALKLRR
ncbi:MAG TPA: heat-inducible transcriptional repressor HrcA [Ectothiorhodospiraceae bacterium]|nr:heat-inducible transcriptional repressor HrcA [Ectothiorhodospiraceae bacterium]